MNILILNWRDIKNPKSGGAEILTHELARRLVRDGHSVTQFSALFENAKKEEIVDGVRFIRNGVPDVRRFFSSVHFKAFLYYRKNNSQFDLIIDEVHGIPFFTPLYSRRKKLALICEVAGNIWDISFKFPFNIIGKTIERIYHIFYQNVRIVTISDSSKKDLSKIGFTKEQIDVLILGCDVPIIKKLPKKNEECTLIFVSRITKSKGIEDAVKSISEIKKIIPNIKLLILGRGEERYVEKIKMMIHDMGLEKNIMMLGFVSEQEKRNYLEKSHILIVPSRKEGWGLTIHEAGSRGTPAIGYNVEGLRDVIVDNVNGIICKNNSHADIAKNALLLFSNEKLYRKLQMGAISERKKYTWDRTYREFLEVLGS